MRSLFYLLPVLIGIAGCAPALANGATASFPAGGVEFKDSADISIAREDLWLSPGEVRVHYQFQSDASDPQTVTIGFPLPRVPSTPDTPDAVGAVDGSGGDARNYLGFGVAVDDRPLIPKLHEYAWLGEAEVTDAVLAAGLPLLPQAGGWEELVATLGSASIARLATVPGRSASPRDRRHRRGPHRRGAWPGARAARYDRRRAGQATLTPNRDRTGSAESQRPGRWEQRTENRRLRARPLPEGVYNHRPG